MDKLIYASSSSVYGNCNKFPFKEDLQLEPLNFYGQTKLMAEKAVQATNPQALIIRTQWLFGPGKRDFVDAILADRHETKVA